MDEGKVLNSSNDGKDKMGVGKSSFTPIHNDDEDGMLALLVISENLLKER